jgi:hypothetical protein
MINVHYQKRKNSELFKSLENPEILFLSKIQNYIPIYKRFFDLTERNFNNINLNHPLYITDIHKNKDEEDNTNNNLFTCSIKNIKNENIKNKPVFFKLAPLLDPFKYLVGKYDIHDPKLFHLPNIHSNETNCITKMIDINNSAYVDGFFLYLTSHLIHDFDFIHGIDFYGSFLSIKNDFKINVFDDLEYLCNSDFFNKHKNHLFQIDHYEHIFDQEKNNKLKPLTIDYSISAKSNLSIKSLNHEMFGAVFDETTHDDKEPISLTDLVDMNQCSNLLIVEEKDQKTTTLKSGSSCSSRTSRTSSSNEECSYCDGDEDDDNHSEDTQYDNSNDNSITSLKDQNMEENDDGEWEDIEDSENDDAENEEDEEEEKVEVTINQFPVQVIAMEYCENTLDDLILNNELSEDEWFSALMQIIMILITYQKTFAFTHNDLHTNNVMYNTTKKKFIFYKYKNIYYKVPTFGRIFKIIDFGRSIYKFQGNLFCSDSFQSGGDAATQYNTEPYFNKNKPRLEPNYSFDLCRLACSIFDYLVEDMDEIKELDKCDPITKLIVEWCLDDKGVNMLYKNNGSDRYPDFKLYKMIARHVHNHTPQAQLERQEFKKYIVTKDISEQTEKIVDIDKIPVFI